MTEDLRRETWRLHARLPGTRRAWARAVNRVREALATHSGTWACNCSGGKDSTAMLGLAVEAGWRGPVFTFTYEETPAENLALARGLAERFDLPFETLRVTGAFDAFRRVGHAFDSPSTSAEAEAVRWMNRSYQRELADHQRASGWAGILVGMRRDESRRRGIVLARKGWLYQVASRPGWTCCPVADLSARDVLARIEHEGLPLLDRYITEDAPELERSEETFLAADVWTRGQRDRWKRRDLDGYLDALGAFPEMGSF